ncbi:hypothetical protein QC761_0032630 [Podospora bellae-mahoneyi]|uniref:Uncharacterized protein n=1 Tax=Podospora bellae-mahoneyi TaxID=2093777 RepID=A0ABR0FQP6_9PEZI|nr:hypothetical protein QC761_0032630 [Podospora bellae-mahoneyi]
MAARIGLEGGRPKARRGIVRSIFYPTNVSRPSNVCLRSFNTTVPGLTSTAPPECGPMPYGHAIPGLRRHQCQGDLDIASNQSELAPHLLPSRFRYLCAQEKSGNLITTSLLLSGPVDIPKTGEVRLSWSDVGHQASVGSARRTM